MSKVPLQYIPTTSQFAEQEDKILKYWEKIDAFRTSVKKSEGKKPYSFYDGPPFATGLPHYGHILAGTIKDIVTRYAHQTGHHVERRFGWDCHGLPIEFEIEKELGIKTRDEVLQMGIDKYNAHCRSIVMRFSEQWRTIVTRLGRWIDFDNDYKTMNLSFMETVWWVFKQLFDKNLVYRGFKVMPYSAACTTPLSNFEANLNYKDTYDPAIMVSFPLVDEPETQLVAWTTTPWTLPSNLALCLHPEMVYVKILDLEKNKTYILAEARLGELYKKKKDKKEEYKVLEKYKGSDLAGKKYVPLFNYFYDKYKNSAFRVICDTFVTSDSGTGIVHCAPGFGEDDYKACLQNKIIEKGEDVPCPLDPNGRFVDPVSDWKGMFVKSADDKICEKLKENGRLVSKGTIVHSYPFCWRSDEPLIYRAVPSWFVRVESIKPQLLKNNDQTYWVPDFVKSKRFHNWLEEARDWAISRSRYWGTPIPIWHSDDWEELLVVGSIQELEELTGKKITDLHRENVDSLLIPSKKGKGMLKRVEDVFDCWFESGSMPYAQCHYPFENKDKFEASFPADFIAEGLDQTRGWFYTLLVLSTALFDKPPFKNLIVNGLVLAGDGKKMSKRLKNYPDPSEVVNEYGADALRLYLINSPVVRAEPLKFKKEGVLAVVKDCFLPWFNAFRFFIENAIRYQEVHGKLFTSTEAAAFKSSNVMDQWIVSLSQSLIKFVKDEMAAYRLYTVIPKLVSFIDQLTNWYVRMNRKRLKGDSGDQDWLASLTTLYDVLYLVCRTMAPFTPFLTETMYQSLRLFVPEAEREESVHYLMIPDYDVSRVNESIERAVSSMQSVIEVGRTLRDRKSLGLKYPVAEYAVCHLDDQFIQDVNGLVSYVLQELNAKKITFVQEVKNFMKVSATADSKALGPRFKLKLKDIVKGINELSHDEVVKLLKEGSVTICGENIKLDDIKINRTFTGDASLYEAQTTADSALVLLNYVLTDDLKAEGQARMLTSAVQQLRKKAGLIAADKVHVCFAVNSDALRKFFDAHKEYFTKTLKNMTFEVVAFDYKTSDSAKFIIEKEEDSNQEKVRVVLQRQ